MSDDTYQQHQIPKSPQTDNAYHTFRNICNEYYKECVRLTKSEMCLSKDDIIVIDDMINELNNYVNVLIKEMFIKESKQLIESGLKIIEFILNNMKLITEIHNNSKQIEKLSYPLSLKLTLLEAYINILFKYEHNYSQSEKHLYEILQIQQFLSLPSYHIASTKFYISLTRFFQNDIRNAEQIALDALSLLQTIHNDKQYDNSKVHKMSNILEFLAEIYDLQKKDYKAIECYEKAYLLNKRKFGDKNACTEYFKMKVDIIKSETNNKLVHTNQERKVRIQKEEMFNVKECERGDMKVRNGIHKGKTETFSFKIPMSHIYEPLIIGMYALGKENGNRYAAELFVCNLCFDKKKVKKFLKEKEMENDMYYTDENLNKVLGNINLINGYVSFLDNDLKDAWINSPGKK